MLQVGTLIRDVSVRELVALVAALYPRARGVDETLELVGISELAERETQKLSGGSWRSERWSR
jgi:ABC-2 type transport system ATP-binding protein